MKMDKKGLREFLQQYYIATYWLGELLKAGEEGEYKLQDIYYNNLYGFIWGVCETEKINEKQRKALTTELINITHPVKESTENE